MASTAVFPTIFVLFLTVSIIFLPHALAAGNDPNKKAAPPPAQSLSPQSYLGQIPWYPGTPTNNAARGWPQSPPPPRSSPGGQGTPPPAQSSLPSFPLEQIPPTELPCIPPGGQASPTPGVVQQARNSTGNQSRAGQQPVDSNRCPNPGASQFYASNMGSWKDGSKPF
ncbi:acidic proline-rich protein PRP25-like [Ananas comosus]|uniref:Acidic proline-rich protein PRP25-like n=1 Tax=Ananas comosus TaxID=4615 RepID=A0A6P5FZP1_ANACO|nr:acidic proline-rich protein PRP25-like [Ananas comosus]